jgi:hypothetical protein
MKRATWTKPSPWVLAPTALMLALTGCVAPAPPPPPQAALPAPPAEPLPKPPPRKPPAPSTAAAAPSAAPSTPVEAAALEPEAAPPAEDPPPQLAAIEPPPPAQPPPAPTPRPTRLIGLNQPEVAQLLGEPQSRAEAPPATIWRYDSSNCALDVYFYLDLQSQAMRALHYEVRSHDAAERSAQRCYETLLSERRATAEPAGSTDHPR